MLIYSATFSTFLTFYTLLVLANLFRYFFRFIVTFCMSFVKAFQANVFRYLFNFLITFYTLLLIYSATFSTFLTFYTLLVLENLFRYFFRFFVVYVSKKIKLILSDIMSYMKACYYWQYSSINYNEKHWFGNNQSAMKHLTSKLGLDNIKHK